jgi:hypothetical protein
MSIRTSRSAACCAAVWCIQLLAGAVWESPVRADESPQPALLIEPAVSGNSHVTDLLVSLNESVATGDDARRVHRVAAFEERVQTVRRASSTRAARKAAIDSLPLGKMTGAHRLRVSRIVDGTSVFRELPSLRFEVDPRVYHFFMEHPDVAVSIWRVMKISEFEMRQTGRTAYETDDGAGTSGAIDVAYLNGNEAVVLCDGEYKSVLLPKPIKAGGLLHLKASFERTSDGRTFVTHSAWMFVTFPSQTVDTAAKIMSPVSYAMIDQNFREVSLFVHMMSLAMQRQPGWVENLSSRLEGVIPSRRTQLMDVTVAVYADARRDGPNLGARPNGPASSAPQRAAQRDVRPTAAPTDQPPR